MADRKERTPKQIVGDVIEQRKASQRYFKDNYYPMWSQLYRNIHGRTKPDYLRGPDGSYKLDSDGQKMASDRTNVCAPDHFVMHRRGTARITRNPPNLRVRGFGQEPVENIEKTSARLMYNWDRSESQRAFKRVVHAAYGFGWGIGKVWYDEVPIVRQLRKLTRSLSNKDFLSLTDSRDPKVGTAVRQFGARLQDQTPLSDEEMGNMVAQLGDEVSMSTSARRYAGAFLGDVFIGDFFPEPGFHALNGTGYNSGYCIENGMHDEEWLKYWVKQQTIDPRTGEEKTVFDPKACDKVLSKAGQRTFLDEQEMTLRRQMRDEIDLADPMTSGKPIRAPRKRFMVDERHTILDGFLCIDYIGEESDYLGRLWYPWETYGRYTYSECVLIPDLLGGIGMSTLSVSQFMMMLKNTRLNQTTDFINNKLLPILKGKKTGDLTTYDLVRTSWGRLLELDSLADIEGFLQDPAFPAEAWSDMAQLSQMMQSTDPSVTDFAPGTGDSPLAGKFATTATLQQKASDSVTSDTLDNLGYFVRDTVELMMWMDQQASNETVAVPKSYFERIDAVSIRGGNDKIINVSAIDIQGLYEVLPEQGSTLSADDQFKVGSLQQLLLLGERHPDIINVRAVATELVKATPGVDTDNVIMPPPPPQPPVPPVKINVSVSIKWEELPPDVQAEIIGKAGLPTEMTHIDGIGHVLRKASEAADHAANLESSAEKPVMPGPGGPPAERPNGKARRSRVQ